MFVFRSSGGLAAMTKSTYESAQFTVNGSQTDYDVKAATGKPSAASRSIEIKASVACSIKLNSTSNDAIAFAAGEQKTFSDYPVSNIYVTTTDATVIRILSFR